MTVTAPRPQYRRYRITVHVPLWLAWQFSGFTINGPVLDEDGVSMMSLRQERLDTDPEAIHEEYMKMGAEYVEVRPL